MSKAKNENQQRLIFTKEMKKEYTILIPSMLDIHFGLIRNALANEGYNVVLLKNSSYKVVEEGLKYVHNDTCYPALLVIGQFIDALGSGEYDLNKTALMITQTGGGCRASNYIHLLRKALKKAGYEHVPVVSLNMSGMEKNPGFKITLPLIRRLVAALVYGDMLMLLRNQVLPYEINLGESEQLVSYWLNTLTDKFNNKKAISRKEVREYLEKIVLSFEKIAVNNKSKLKTGVVGEIYVKYSALANNSLEKFLHSQDCEVMVPGLMGFMLFKVDNRLEDIKLYGGSRIKRKVVMILKNFITDMETAMLDVLKDHPRFVAPSSFEHTKSLVKGVIGYGNKMGEGWLLTAEMLELAEQGYENIVCAQPFGCLPNHICGKGMIHKIKEKLDNANIVAIDYDPSATKVNQENRIKLMLAVGREAMQEREGVSGSDKTQKSNIPYRETRSAV